MNHIGGSYCFTMTDMLKDVGKKDLGFSKSSKEKREMAKSIAQDFMKLVLDDVINNGILFRFSTPTEAYIQIEGVYGEEFKRQRLQGRFYDTDPFLSNFTGHELNLVWKGKRYYRRPIVVNSDLKDIITNKTNAGYKY